jgi:hypothetical protein
LTHTHCSPSQPQVYFNEQKHTGGKPKWKLRQGIGPAAIELSRAKDNCVYKKSLTESGITDGIEYDPEGAGRCEYDTDGTAVPKQGGPQGDGRDGLQCDAVRGSRA